MAHVLGVSVGSCGVGLLIVGGFLVFWGLMLTLWSQENELLKSDVSTSSPRQQESTSNERQAKNQETANTANPAIQASPVLRAGNDAQAKPRQREANSGNTKESKEWSDEAYWDWWFAAALVFCGFCQMIVGYWQWGSMSDQNRIMESQISQADETLGLMKEQQRPWVLVDAPQHGNLLETASAGGEILVSNIRNAGNSPAWVVFCDTSVFFMQAGRADLLEEKVKRFVQDANAKQGHTGALGPGGSYQIKSIALQVVPDEIRKRFVSGEMKVFCMSYVRYEDLFHRKHWSISCYEYLPEFNVFTASKVYNGLDQGSDDPEPFTTE